VARIDHGDVAGRFIGDEVSDLGEAGGEDAVDDRGNPRSVFGPNIGKRRSATSARE